MRAHINLTLIRIRDRQILSMFEPDRSEKKTQYDCVMAFRIWMLVFKHASVLAWEGLLKAAVIYKCSTDC